MLLRWESQQYRVCFYRYHHYRDGSEQPIANISKTLMDTQGNYSQIQKEALSVILALKKILCQISIPVTYHSPLLALFRQLQSSQQTDLISGPYC